MRSSSFFVLCLLIGSLHTHAQVVNIESARIQSDTTGWAGSGGAGFSIQKNTRQILTLGLEAHVQYKTRKDLWLLLGDHGFLKSDKEKFVSNSFLHLRYNRKLNKWLRWEVFLQAQNNYITQIRRRTLAGTGPRFKIVSTPKFRLYAASLIMYEYEVENTSPKVTHRDLRNSSYISFTYLPIRNIEVINTIFYQPRVNDFSDARVFQQAVLRVRATDHFGMYIKWNYLYDRKPAGVAPKTTYQFISGFNFEL